MVGRGALQIEICTPRKKESSITLRLVSSLAGLSPPHTLWNPSPARNAASVPVEKPGMGAHRLGFPGNGMGGLVRLALFHPHRVEHTPPN